MNDQRKAIFGQRLEIMEAEDLSEIVQDMRHQVIDDLIEQHLPPKAYVDQWDIAGLGAALREWTTLDLAACRLGRRRRRGSGRHA